MVRCLPLVCGALPHVYVGPIATAFAYWAMVEVGRHVRATTTSMTLLGVPCVGLLISALTFHEAFDVSFGLGIALVNAGILLTALVPVKSPSSEVLSEPRQMSLDSGAPFE
jgi:drug/metabolite transporter (DMT)-like permease